MQRKKGILFTFLFSLIPGAGEMYLGFMKKGISLMAVFYFIIALANTFGLDYFIFILPIIWCYSFFNVHNTVGLSDEEFYALEDHYIIDINTLFPEEIYLTSKFKKIAAAILIILGVSIFWQNMIRVVYYFIPNIYHQIFDIMERMIPQVILASILIFCGVQLIRGKKKKMDILLDEEGNY